MLKFIAPLLITFAVIAQDNSQDHVDMGLHKYVMLEDNKVYDVEIIVFAYQKTLPNNKTFKNKAIFDDSNALELEEKPEDLKLTRIIDVQSDDEEQSPDISTNNVSQFTVSLEDDKSNIEVLTWFKHKSEFFQLTPIWEKLLKQANIVPLVHQAWRQTETEFNNPIYVKISNLAQDSDQEESIATDIIEQPSLIKNTSVISPDQDWSVKNKPIYSDYSMKGMVALSKGRYTHFGHNINLFRTYNDSEGENHLKNMVFSITERRQIKVDQLNYFDSPWFGSIVKITEYKGEEQNEVQAKE